MIKDDIPDAYKYTDNEYTKINDWLVNQGFYLYVPDKGCLFKGEIDIPLSEIVVTLFKEQQKENKELKGMLKCTLNYYEDGDIDCEGMIGATKLFEKIKVYFKNA